MKCIYDKTIPCELNPDGPRTKDFICLKCHKPEEKSKNKSIETQEKKKTKQTFFNVRGKKRGTPPKKRGLGRGRRRRRRV
jgi:hypothetical protein